VDRRGQAPVPPDRQGPATIDQRRSDSDALGDDLPELATCELLDEYWEELQDQSSPDPRHWQNDGDSPDQRFTGDLGVLNLLHQLRQSEHGGNPSQARTVRLHAPFGLVAEPPRADLDRAGLPDCDEIDGAPGSPSPANGAPTATLSWPRRIGKYVVIELLTVGGNELQKKSEILGRNGFLYPKLKVDVVGEIGTGAVLGIRHGTGRSPACDLAHETTAMRFAGKSSDRATETRAGKIVLGKSIDQREQTQTTWFGGVC